MIPYHYPHMAISYHVDIVVDIYIYTSIYNTGSIISQQKYHTATRYQIQPNLIFVCMDIIGSAEIRLCPTCIPELATWTFKNSYKVLYGFILLTQDQCELLSTKQCFSLVIHIH